MGAVKRSITAAAAVHAPAPLVVAVLSADPAVAFAPALMSGARRGPALVATLTMELPAGGAATQQVELRVGPPEPVAEGATSFSLTWHALGRERLFPTFDGRLLVVESDAAGGDTELRLEGEYRPPLRALGAFADGLVGHRLARASLTAFLRDAARRVDAEVARRPPNFTVL